MDSNKLPDTVEVGKMVKARSREIMSLMNEVAKKMPKQANQRLPRVLRRRAASNNPKRVPKACRAIWFRSEDKDKVSLAKEKKRRQLKKHISQKQREESIQRRKNRPDRSLLHVWFAKRFKMDRVHGIIIPIKNSTKNQRNLFRKSKDHCVYYYMSPYLRSFEISGRKSDISRTLMDMIPFKMHYHEELDDHFRIEIHGEDKKCIELELLFLPNKTLVFCHFSVAQEVEKVLSNHFDTMFTSSSDKYERIRLVGPEADKRIKSYLDIDVCFTQETPFFIYEEKIFVRFSIGDRHVIDIISLREETRDVWGRLVRNRGHFVGGLRNLEMLHFNVGQILFPSFGYPDHPFSTRVSGLDFNLDDPDMRVIRGPHLKFLSSLDNQALFDHLNTQDYTPTQTLFPVVMTAVGKGTPVAGTRVLIPSTEDDLSSPTTLGSGTERVTCGVVEFGEYCLQEGTGKGMAFITMSGFIEILSIHLKAKGVSNDKKCIFQVPNSSCVRVGIIRLSLN